jgi:hypothetical protein
MASATVTAIAVTRRAISAGHKAVEVMMFLLLAEWHMATTLKPQPMKKTVRQATGAIF